MYDLPATRLHNDGQVQRLRRKRELPALRTSRSSSFGATPTRCTLDARHNCSRRALHYNRQDLDHLPAGTQAMWIQGQAQKERKWSVSQIEQYTRHARNQNRPSPLLLPALQSPAPGVATCRAEARFPLQYARPCSLKRWVDAKQELMANSGYFRYHGIAGPELMTNMASPTVSASSTSSPGGNF